MEFCKLKRSVSNGIFFEYVKSVYYGTMENQCNCIDQTDLEGESK